MAFSVPASKKSGIISTVEDEKFVQIFTPDEEAVQLTNNGRSIMNVKPSLFACALGIHSYSSGIHRIRTRIDKHFPFLGIRSQNIPPVPDELVGGCYILSPSSYGWFSHWRYVNGKHHDNHWNKISRTDHVWTIILDCDQHRLHIIDENTNEQDETEVDICQAPLPWCLFVGLSRTTDGISLI
jgi:hypothetical protein